MRKLLMLIALLPALVHGQLVVTNTQTPAWLVQNLLLGQGVSVSNITFNGAPGNTVTAQVGEFDGTATNLGMGSGMILATGDVVEAIGPNDLSGITVGGGFNGQGDPDLLALAQATGNAPVTDINDAAVVEFDFVPTGDSLKFDFTFASDEFLEFVQSYNDVFGFFLSGPGIAGPYTNGAINIALIPNTTSPVAISTVNNVTNSTFYVDNGDGNTAPFNTNPMYIQYDGRTVTITARAQVTCGLTYHIKLAVGDANDTAVDSGVFLKAGSFTSTGQVIPDLASGVNVVNDTIMLEGCGMVELDFTRMGDTGVYDTVNVVIGGTATAGVDYFPALPTQLLYQPGDTMIPVYLTLPLDADGIETLTITITQNIVCSGTQITNTYTYYIDTPPPLTVNTTDINGACGLSYLLNPLVAGGTGNYTYDWSTGASTPSITVSPGVTTTYYLTVSDTCSVVPVSDSIVVTMPVYAPLQITLTPDTLIDCLGLGPIGVLNATGGNGVYQYSWSLNGNPMGQTPTINVPAADPPVYYVATVTEGCGTSVSDSVQVGTVPLPPIHITTSGVTVVCPGDTVTLQVDNVVGGNGVYTYQWTNGQGQVLSQNDAVTVTVPADAAYTITVNDQCGYEGDTTVFTLLPIYEPFRLSLTNDTTICYGEQVVLFADVTGGSGFYTVFWPDQQFTDPEMPVTPLAPTTYPVYVIDECGAVLSDAVTVTPEPVSVDIEVTNRGQDDWFLQAATFPICNFHLWDMGDGTRYRNPDITHSYLDLDEHWVTLEVRTIHGCVGIDSVLLRPPAHLYFPNAFTPDGDGVNETWKGIGHYIERFELEVYDRWGELIFATTDFERSWDGSVNGTGAAMTGVYVYKYKAEGHLFPAVEGMGHVTLLRGSQD
ncbi:MAG: choice-of-anchor L domain-containing protein [Flavobacteriales bacterium]|nr:choice-of-anchor L domain-containing protein [Flavobacteriales bacterium]